MTHWLKQALPHLAAMACTLVFLAGLVPPSIAFAQTLVTQTDTPALHFRDYGLRSLEPLLTDEARRGLASGRIRPSLTTFLDPARYGLIAPSDAGNAVSVTELLCLNRENRSLQLACKQEGGTRRVIRLSEEACAQQTPLPSLLPHGCRPYVSTIEGRPVAIRRAQRPETIEARDADLIFTDPTTESATAAPPQATHLPSSQTGPPSPPAQALDPPRGQVSRDSREVLALRRENARLRRQLTFALGLPAILFLLALGYTIARAWRARKPIPSAQEEPAPDVVLETHESAPVSLRDELRAAREEAQTVAERLQREEQRRTWAEQERREVVGKLSTLNERADRLAAENAQLREENATRKSIDEALRAELKEALESAEETERRCKAAEHAYADQRQAHASIEDDLLKRNHELMRTNGRLQQQLAEQIARNEQAAQARAAEADLPHNEPRNTLTQGFAVEGLHPPLDVNAEEETRRLTDAQMDEVRRQGEATVHDHARHPVSSDDEPGLDFSDLNHDLPTVFQAPARPTAPDGSPNGQERTRTEAPSIHDKVTEAHAACPQLRRESRLGDSSPTRGKTVQMPAAQQAEYVAATRQPLDDDQELARRDRDSLRELGALTQPQQDSGVWPRRENDDRASIQPAAPGHAGAPGDA